MADCTYVKAELRHVHESNWRQKLEETATLIDITKRRIRDMVMTTPRVIEEQDWIDWAGIEIEEELNSLMVYAAEVRLLHEIESNLEYCPEDVEFPKFDI